MPLRTLTMQSAMCDDGRTLGGASAVLYKVLRIEEDIDFGCEERQPGEALMSVVILEDENGREMSLRHDDRLLYERNINEGDMVMLDEKNELKKGN